MSLNRLLKYGGFLGMGGASDLSLYPTLQNAVSKALSEFRFKSSPDKEDNEVCKACVTEASMSIVEHVKWAAAAVCDKEDEAKMDCPACDRKKRFCMWWKKDPEEALGFLIVKVRPIQDAYFYCLGKQVCKHPGESNPFQLFTTSDFAKLSFVDPSASSCDALEHVEGIHSLLNGHKELTFRGPDHPSFMSRLAQMFSGKKEKFMSKHSPELGEEKTEVQVSRQLREEEDHVNPFFHHDQKRDVCKHCFRKTMRLVTDYAVEKTKEMCEEGPKCPYLSGWCKWAAISAHHRIARGMIVAKVEPWKYAMGRCADWGPHGKHHHGDHHEEPLPPPTFMQRFFQPFGAADPEPMQVFIEVKDEDKDASPVVAVESQESGSGAALAAVVGAMSDLVAGVTGIQNSGDGEVIKTSLMQGQDAKSEAEPLV